MIQEDALKIGKAGEYFVCADLIKNGFIAFPTEQGLPYDVIMDNGEKLYRVQVKTTLQPRKIPQRFNESYAYIFNVKRHGNINNLRPYKESEVDLFALVALDINIVAYLLPNEMKQTKNFRCPNLKGKYYDEQGKILKENVIELKKQGLSLKDISLKLNLKLSNVEKYSSVDITPKGNNKPVYFNEYPIKRLFQSNGRTIF